MLYYLYLQRHYFSEGQSKLVNVPELSDVETINNVLSTLNANVEYDKDKNAVKVDATKTLNEEALMNMWVKCEQASWLWDHYASIRACYCCFARRMCDWNTSYWAAH